MIIINDEICNDNKILFDEGYSFGRGLFETILVKKEPVFLQEHLERLNSGLVRIGIKQFLTKEAVIKNINKLECENCGVKIIVSDKNVIFTKREIKYTKEQYDNGFSIIVTKVKRNESSMLTYLKSINYMDNILEREKAQKKGYDEVLFLNHEGAVCEGSISNVFFIRNNKIYTPSIKCGLLNGIVRQRVINKYSAVEGEYKIEELIDSDGIFITNSLIGIMAISKINGNIVNRSAIVDSIRLDYNEYISGDISR